MVSLVDPSVLTEAELVNMECVVNRLTLLRASRSAPAGSHRSTRLPLGCGI